MFPLITIIVPVYNVEDFLAECIDSLLAQTYSNIEIIIVDDGSTDNSPVICELYAEKDQRIKVFHKNNSGQSCARNLGLDHANGDYIAFVDSDDFVSPFFIEHMYQRIVSDNSDIVFCEYQEVGDEELLHKVKRVNQVRDTVISDEVWQWESLYYMFCVALWNKLYKAEIWKNLRFKENKYAEDNFAFTEYMKKVNLVSVLKEQLYYYRQRKNSEVHSYTLKNLDSIEARLERADYCVSIKNKKIAKKILLRLSGSFLRAHSKLDMNNQATKNRYYELLYIYKNLYRKADCRFGFSKLALESYTFVNSECLAFFLYDLVRKNS